MLDRLVTLFGGGGFVGRYVAQELLTAGVRIRVAERNPADAFFLKPLGNLGQTQFVAADITRPESLPRALSGADVAINFVGILDGDFETVHAKGARNAAKAAKEAGVRDFVQISAIGAASNAPSRYLRTKAAGEDAVRDIYPDAIVIRPSIIFGPEDGFINRFASMAKMAPFVLPVLKADAKFQPVYVADLGEVVARAALEPAAHRGETYELGGPDVMTMGEVNRFILDAIGKRDKGLLKLPDGFGKFMSAFGFMPGAPMTRDQWNSLHVDSVVAEGAKGFEAFGIAPRPLAAVADRWLVKYRENGRFANKAASEA